MLQLYQYYAGGITGPLCSWGISRKYGDLALQVVGNLEYETLKFGREFRRSRT
jgi:hypothetical protein